jgi:hypothetical protein
VPPGTRFQNLRIPCPSTISRPDTPPTDEEPARQALAARVGIGIGIGIGIENSQGRTGFDPNTPRQPRAFQSRGPRPGGPSDDSPARERWVPSHHQHPAPAGRQIPRFFTLDSNAPLKRIPHARFAQDAKTPRQEGIRSSSLPPFASSPLRVRFQSMRAHRVCRPAGAGDPYRRGTHGSRRGLLSFGPPGLKRPGTRFASHYGSCANVA